AAKCGALAEAVATLGAAGALEEEVGAPLLEDCRLYGAHRLRVTQVRAPRLLGFGVALRQIGEACRHALTIRLEPLRLRDLRHEETERDAPPRRLFEGLVRREAARIADPQTAGGIEL